MEKNTKKVISLFIIFAILIELYVCFGVIINYILSMVLTMIFGYLIYPIVVLIFLILVPTLIVFIFKKKI